MTATVYVSQRCNREIPGAIRGNWAPTLKEQARAIPAASAVEKEMYDAADRVRCIRKQLELRDSDPEMRARIEVGFAELIATLKRELLPSTLEQLAKAKVDRRRRDQRRAEIKAEWGDRALPTIGGIPMSRELLATVKGPQEAGTMSADALRVRLTAVRRAHRRAERHDRSKQLIPEMKRFCKVCRTEKIKVETEFYVNFFNSNLNIPGPALAFKNSVVDGLTPIHIALPSAFAALPDPRKHPASSAETKRDK